MNRKLWFVVSVFAILALIVAGCGGAEATDGTGVETPGVEATDVLPETGATDTPVVEMEETPTMVMEPTMAATEEMTGTVEPTMAATEEMTGTETVPLGDPAEGLEEIGGTVDVLATWTDVEQDNFMAMIQPFLDATGIEIQFTGTRDLNAVLTSRVQGGNPPDLAGLPGPGALLSFARSGDLVPLNDVLDMDMMQSEYDQGFLDLATVDDQLYGIFIKGAVKSLVWYSPPAFEAAGYTVPTTWEELQALEQQIIDDGKAPWCIGMESGATSGWPGTDWIEDILLHSAGPETYDAWVEHQIPWTDDAVRNAWETFGEIVNDPQMVFGGQQYVLSTAFGTSFTPMFEEDPDCYMHRQADFITSFFETEFPDLVALEGYDFFPFPAPNAEYDNVLLVAGDLFGMFNDTPQARALINYMAKAEAQAIWAERGGFFSANRRVPASVYPSEITQQVGELLANADAVRFDGSDLMPDALQSTFLRTILDYVSGTSDLDAVLQELETAATEAIQEQPSP